MTMPKPKTGLIGPGVIRYENLYSNPTGTISRLVLRDRGLYKHSFYINVTFLMS